MTLAGIIDADYVDISANVDGLPEFKSQLDLDAHIVKLENDMREAAKRFEFEVAAKLRDMIRDLKTKEFMFT
jgi:excinuclease ABC subunit B